MPFLPSSPTKLYSKNKKGNLDRSAADFEQEDLSMVRSMRDFRKSTFKPASLAPKAAEGAGSGNETSSPRSISSWNGALICKSITNDKSQEDEDRLPHEKSSSTMATTTLDEEFINGRSVGEAQTNDYSALQNGQSMGRAQSSLFDNTSESEYSIEEDVRPVLGRASSVRVSKPQIVQHKHMKQARLRVQDYSRHKDSAVQAHDQVTGQNTPVLPTMSEEGRPSIKTLSIVSAASTDTLTKSRKVSDTSSHGQQASDSMLLNTGIPLATGSTFKSLQASIVNPDTPYESDTMVPANDEPPPEQVVRRARTTPLPLPGKGLSRRVSIRPADLVIATPTRRNTFRESIVTTPYPPRRASDASKISDNNDVTTEEPAKNGSDTERTKARRVSFSRTSPGRDRFPSPERPEVIFLDLSLARHPAARITIEIQITDKGTFDDEMLFQHIKTAYSKQLLGPRRLGFLLVRKIGNVSAVTSSTSANSDFDTQSFIKHFHIPHLGYKRKAWTIWLRNNNPRSPGRPSTLPHPASIRQINDLNRLSLRTQGIGHTTHNKTQNTDLEATTTNNKKRFSTASDASSFNFIYSPANPRLPFTSPSNHEHTTATQAPTTPSPARSFFSPSDSPHPTTLLLLTHEFRVAVVAGLTLLNILQAALLCVVWVVFGVPGTRPGMDDAVGATDWRVGARARVLTGVVLGLTAFLIGSVLEAALVWGSWVLL